MLKTKERGTRFLLLVALISAVFLSLSAWALASPVGSSPDDDFHLASIWCGQGTRENLCETGSRADIRKIPAAFSNVACFAYHPESGAQCQTELGVFAEKQLVETTRGSFQGEYPPVFYWTMGLFVGPNIEFSVILMRLLNVAIFVLGNTVIWNLLRKEQRPILFWMWVVTLVPLGLFLITSINPSSWTVMGVGFGWISLYGYFSSANKTKIAFGLTYGLSVLMAAGARADGAIYMILVSMLTSLYFLAKSRVYLYSLILPMASSLFCLAMYLGARQSSVVTNGFGETPGLQGRSPLGVLAHNLVDIPQLWVGIFGSWGLGWLDTGMPSLVWVTLFAVFVATIFVMFKAANSRSRLVLFAFACLLYVIPLYFLQQGLNHVGEQVQPRYLLPLIIVAAGIAFSTIEHKRGLISLRLSYMLLSAVCLAEAVALYVNLKRYVSGLSSGGGIFLDQGAQWWWALPVSPMFVWGVGVASFTLAIILARKVLPRDQALE